MKSWRLTVGALATVGALLGGACGGDDSGDDAQSTVTTADSSTTTEESSTTSEDVTTTASESTGEGACQYVSTAEASELAASPVKPGVNRTLPSGPVTFEYCDYIFDPGNAPGVSVAVADLGGDGESLFAQFRQSEQAESAEFQEVSGVGDEAFFAGQNLNVREGDVGLILYVGRADGFPRGLEGLDDEKELAELILGRL